jgi:hypothetical protein
MFNFSIFDSIGNDNDYAFDERDYKKLRVPPKQSSPSNHELTAATQTQTEKHFSIYDSMGLS